MNNLEMAELFHNAADEFLSEEDRYDHDSRSSRFSCVALQFAAEAANIKNRFICQPFVQSLGVDTNAGTNAGSLFEEFPRKSRQPIRYAWLKFCAFLLEENPTGENGELA